MAAVDVGVVAQVLLASELAAVRRGRLLGGLLLLGVEDNPHRFGVSGRVGTHLLGRKLRPHPRERERALLVFGPDAAAT